MQALDLELRRSFPVLKNAGGAPIHYLGYRVYDTDSLTISASDGALNSSPDALRYRLLNVDIRAGTPKLDSTHSKRSTTGLSFDSVWQENAVLPFEDDVNALRLAIWDQTDRAFKLAQKDFKQIKASQDVLVDEEDLADDFSPAGKVTYLQPATDRSPVNVDQWSSRLRRLSALFEQHRQVIRSSVTLSAEQVKRSIATSEGTRIEDSRAQFSITALAEAVADDGMRIWLYDQVLSPKLADLPDEQALAVKVKQLAAQVEKLRNAPPAEPYVGPAILRSKAAGVFFHEVFGHRAEGHRQKNEDEGRTFSNMLGKRIMPSFISVFDDPTCARLGSGTLNGFYAFDDEGVPAQRVTLVDKGVLRGFLLGRSPISSGAVSNGHGRCSANGKPVARQGNLIVRSTKTTSDAELRAMLIAETKRQRKPYGLIFDEIAGGFTVTQNWMPQVFKLLPLQVYKVYADGRPDQLLRGVSIIGTPLSALEKILCAGRNLATFNGECGAESGSVPVSATAPSLLLQTIEVERERKDQEKPPILPPP